MLLAACQPSHDAQLLRCEGPQGLLSIALRAALHIPVCRVFVAFVYAVRRRGQLRHAAPERRHAPAAARAAPAAAQCAIAKEAVVVARGAAAARGVARGPPLQRSIAACAGILLVEAGARPTMLEAAEASGQQLCHFATEPWRCSASLVRLGV